MRLSFPAHITSLGNQSLLLHRAWSRTCPSALGPSLGEALRMSAGTRLGGELPPPPPTPLLSATTLGRYRSASLIATVRRNGTWQMRRGRLTNCHPLFCQVPQDPGPQVHDHETTSKETVPQNAQGGSPSDLMPPEEWGQRLTYATRSGTCSAGDQTRTSKPLHCLHSPKE